jgi:hypothetical protein
MLDVALNFFADELNTYVAARAGTAVGKVKPSAIVDDQGKYSIDEDSIGAALINVEEVTTVKSQRRQYDYVDGQHVVVEPDIKLNLYVLFAAHYKVYTEALKFISHVVTFFQSHASFRQQEFPTLDPRIEKMTAELQSVNYEQLNQIWAYIGGKQLPSVIYKIRMIVLQDPAVLQLQPPVTQIETELTSK